MVDNNGEVPQYLVEQSHEAIVLPEEFDAVQEEMARRKQLGRAYSDKAFHSKIICGDCGGFYGRKVWHSNDEYRSVIFQCNRKFANENHCYTPTLTEDEIKESFVKVCNEFSKNKSGLLADCELMRETMCDTSALEAEMCEKQTEMSVATELMSAHIKKNAAAAQSQTEYAAETERIEKRYNDAMVQFNALEAEKANRLRKSKEIQAFTALLKSQPTVVSEWSERLWITLLDTATVMANSTIVFRFKNGKEIHI